MTEVILGLMSGLIVGLVIGWVARGRRRVRLMVNHYLQQGLARGVTDQYVKALVQIHQNPVFNLVVEGFALAVYGRYASSDRPKNSEAAFWQAGYREAGAHFFNMIESVKEIDENGRRDKQDLERSIAAGTEGGPDF